MPLNILVVGAGCCGPAFATLLLRADPSHQITVIERAPELRTGGQQIDLRSQGIPVMHKLGLLEKAKAARVPEAGIAFVDDTGRQRAVFGLNTSGQGQQALTSEYEIMRGDLVHILYEASLEAGEAAARATGGIGGVEYRFGTTITALTQNDDDNSVEVTFASGEKARYNLVVGADGQGSRTRRLLFGEADGRAAFNSLRCFVAYYSIPPGEGDSDLAQVCNLPGSRTVCLRSNGRPVTQCYLTLHNADSEKMRHLVKSQGPADDLKEAWAALFDDVKWATRDRVMAGLRASTDFYAQEIGQVQPETWHRGRVVLLGDAGYCPSPITGCGSTAALVGAYVLAGELATRGRGRDAADVDIPAALAAYEDVLRPFVAEVQRLPPGAPDWAAPNRAWGITLFHAVLGTISTLGLDQLANRLLPANKGGWDLPEYPELHLEELEEHKA